MASSRGGTLFLFSSPLRTLIRSDFVCSLSAFKSTIPSRRVIPIICDGTICRDYSSGVRIACLSTVTITLHDARSTDDRTRLPIVTWGANDCRGHLLLPPPSMSPFNLKSSSAYTARVRRTATFRGVPCANFLQTTQPHQLPSATGSSALC